MPHTFCALLEAAVAAGCAVTTSLHHTVLPQSVAAPSMGGQALAQLYSWVVMHGCTSAEETEMQKEFLRLSRFLGALLTRREDGFPAWCAAAADVMLFHSTQSSSSADNLSRAVQEATAQRIFWQMLTIAANNRPTAMQQQTAAGVRRGHLPRSKLPLPVQIQQVFLDTLARLSTSAETAGCLLPQRLQVTIQKLLAKADASSSEAKKAGSKLRFDAVAAELLSAAASPACCMPLMVLYLSYTRSEAPQYARGLKAVMVDQQASQAPGGHQRALELGLPLFCVVGAASQPAAAGAVVAGLQPAAVVTSEPLQQ